jgi:hypothetical protein
MLVPVQSNKQPVRTTLLRDCLMTRGQHTGVARKLLGAE